MSRLTGSADRALKLLSLTTAGEAAEPRAASGSRTVAASASLRDVLSDLVWRGADAATVLDADGTTCGTLTLAAMLAHGRQD